MSSTQKALPWAMKFPDVSHYERGCDFAAMVKAGIRLCITKATEGAKNVDSLFGKYWPAMKLAGLKRFCYVFLLPNEAGSDILHFEDTTHLGSGDGQPIVDAEKNGLTASTVNAAMADLEARNLKPILYCSYAFWHDVLGSPSKWALWLADYNVSMPKMPTTVRMFAWQFAEDGTCPGVPHPCDVNVLLTSNLSEFLIP